MTKRGGEVKQERKRAKRVNTDADADLLEVISYLNQHQYFSLCLKFSSFAVASGLNLLCYFV
jgi:hypothetical protein